MKAIIQITTRCNMRCPHCCFDCTSEGIDLSLEDFKKIISILNPYGVLLTGGEPTIHPNFWEIFWYLRDNYVDVLVTTNGKRTEDAIRLAQLASERKCAAILSLDEFHERPEISATDAFAGLFNCTKTLNPKNKTSRISQHSSQKKDRRYIQTMFPQGVVQVGRAAKNGIGNPPSSKCYCDGDLFVTPRGHLYRCVCVESNYYGNLLTHPECWKQKKTMKWLIKGGC